MGAADGRVTVDAAAAPWRSLARLQIPGESRCTAFLVAPTTVLTAAHCLWSRRLRHAMPANTVHVLTGYTAGSFSRHAVAVSYRLADAGTDIAVVTLPAPMGEALPLADSDPPVGTAVVLGGYNQDRSEVIEADMACHALGVSQGKLAHDCAGTHGTSGAPLLAQGADGKWQVVGLQFAAFTEHGGGLAVPATRLRQVLSQAAH